MLPKRPALGVKLCPHCGKQFNVRGYGMHQKACKEPDGPIPVIDADSIDPEPGKDGTSCKLKSQCPYLNTPATDDLIQVVGISDDPHTEGVQESEESDEASGSGKCGLNCAADWCAHPRDVLIGSDTQTLRDGDIVIEYHPHSKKSTRILSPNEFKESLYHRPDPTVAPVDNQPWQPFSTREDFDFSELVHDMKLNRNQIEQLIKLIQQCQDVLGSFTLRKYTNLQKVLNRSANLLTQVTAFWSFTQNHIVFTSALVIV